jgi:hypothetical protein
MDREAFLKASKLRQQDLEIPEVGVITIRELTTGQRKQYIEYLELDKDNKPTLSIDKQVEMNKFIISLGVISEDGSRMFASPTDVPDMRQDMADTIAKGIMVLSGILPSEVGMLPLTEKPTSDTPSQSS